MAMSGTLDEVLGKTYDLYMEDRINDLAVTWYLLHLKHEDGSLVFSPENVLKLLEKLQKDKAGMLRGVLGV